MSNPLGSLISCSCKAVSSRMSTLSITLTPTLSTFCRGNYSAERCTTKCVRETRSSRKSSSSNNTMPPTTMPERCHVISCGTPEQAKRLTNSHSLDGYAQNRVSYWVCVPSPSLELPMKRICCLSKRLPRLYEVNRLRPGRPTSHPHTLLDPPNPDTP